MICNYRSGRDLRRLALALADRAHAERVARHFRAMGWEVYVALTGSEARRFIEGFDLPVAVLDTRLPDESGWLVCQKLSRGASPPYIILYGDCCTVEDRRFAKFAGASAVIGADNGITALSHEILAALSPAEASVPGRS